MTNPRPAGLRPVQLGRVFGVPVFLAPSWLLIAAFVTVSFGDVFTTAVDGIGSAAGHLLALAFAVLVALCVLLHELGHTAVALLLRLRVRRVVIFLLGGASEIDPEPNRPRDEFLVSAAGPLTSGLLAAVCWAVRHYVDGGTALGVELDLMIWSNLSIAVFNALPGLPLDGGRVLRAVVWGGGASRLSATRIAAWVGRGLAVVVALSGLLVARGNLGIVSVMLSAGLGAFLWFAASQNLLAARIADRLPTVHVSDLVRPAVWVPAAMPIAEALRRAAEQQAGAIVVVDAAETARAIVDDTLLAAVPGAQRPWTGAGSVARTIAPNAVLPIGLSGQALLAACQQSPAARYLVTDGDHQIGVLTAADLRAALEAPDATRTETPA